MREINRKIFDQDEILEIEGGSENQQEVSFEYEQGLGISVISPLDDKDLNHNKDSYFVADDEEVDRI